MKKILLLLLSIISISAMAQNQDANPYMGMWYADHHNYRMYGADVLTRTTRAAAEARVNVIKGDHCYDTLAQEILFYNGTDWIGLDGGGNTLDQAYDQGGAGLGREIVADNGAVKVSGTDGLLVTGTFGSGADSEWSGAGTGMFFNPKKAAFRAGSVDGTQWDNASIGDYSTAMGFGTTASGESSTAMGEETTASGESSTAMGQNTAASGDYSTAMGLSTTASGGTSTAMGFGTIASGDYSTAMGGNTTASGESSTAMGFGTTAKSYVETAMGSYHTDYTPISTVGWQATDRLFVIGNGTGIGNESDALVMLKNGETTLNGSLAIATTTGAFTPPVMTTTERDALTATAGMFLYCSDCTADDASAGVNQTYNGTTWKNHW